MNILTEPQCALHETQHYVFVAHVDGIDYYRSTISVSRGSTNLVYASNDYGATAISLPTLESRGTLTPAHQYVWNLIKLSA